MPSCSEFILIDDGGVSPSTSLQDEACFPDIINRKMGTKTSEDALRLTLEAEEEL